MGNSESNLIRQIESTRNEQLISFIDASKNPHKSQNTEKDHSLLNLTYHSINFKLIPKTFTLLIKNQSKKFNIELLCAVSPYIANCKRTNPDKLEYDLLIEDDQDILSKFSELFNMEKVVFKKYELPKLNSLCYALSITKCPTFMKEYVKNDDDDNTNYSIQIDPNTLNNFINSNKIDTFIISTNKKEYKCNLFGIYSSILIRDFLVQNPQIKRYDFDFKDEYNEFQTICDLFNFKSVSITMDNIDSIAEISGKLQIESIYSKIDKNYDDFEKFSEDLDQQQEIVDLIEEVFNWLYNIKFLTVETVIENIVKSDFVKTEDDVRELAAFILQVIETDMLLHPYLIDLLIELDNKANELSNLAILKPLIVKKVIDAFGNDLTNCSFVYKLYKKGLITHDKLKDKIARCNINNNIIRWFLPELKESNRFFINLDNNPIAFYFPNKLKEYNQMRDSGISDDKLTQSLRIDDLDTFQSIVSSIKIKLETYTIPYNIFDDFEQKGSMNIINYAAAYGSIKCFKYLILNHVRVDLLTFKFAIYGGNIEIIRITDQHLSQSSMLLNTNISLIFSTILSTISYHRNELFDWLIEHKYYSKIKNNYQDLTVNLLRASALEGNAHSMIELINKRCDYSNLFRNMVNTSSNEGFYRFTQTFINLNDKISKVIKRSSKKYNGNTIIVNDPYRIKQMLLNTVNTPFISFGNLSIFKLGLKMNPNQAQLEQDFTISVHEDYNSIIEYFFENVNPKVVQFSNFCVFNAISNSITNENTNDRFHYLINKFKHANPKAFYDTSKMINLVNITCQIPNIDASKTLTKIILDNKLEADFTNSFLSSVESKSFELCQFFIDNKVLIKYIEISKQEKICNTTIDIFKLIINNATPEAKERIISSCLYSAINYDNGDVVKYLLNLGAPYDNALIEAIDADSEEIIDIILEHDSRPSFINKITKDGTALCLATELEDIETVKKLLSLPGIDPSLYRPNGNAPLVLAIQEESFKSFDEIIKFYGENIQSQAYQLNNALQILLRMISKKIYPRIEQVMPILELLLGFKFINPNIHIYKNTLLAYFCSKNNKELVQKLLERDDINVNEYIPCNGNTPLMVAIQNNNVEIAKLLIEDKRTNINLRNYKNKSPLIVAVNYKLDEIVDMLVKSERFDPEESNINYAFFISTGEISKKLINTTDVDVNYNYINAKFKSNYNSIGKINYHKSVLYNAVSHNDTDKFDLIIQHPSFDKDKSHFELAFAPSIKKFNLNIFRKLLKLVNDDVNFQIDNKTLLNLAISYKSNDIISEILNSPLFDSEKSGLHKEFCQVFYKWKKTSLITLKRLCDFDKTHAKCIDFNKLLPNGETFLTSIKSTPQIGELVSLVLENGADPNIPNIIQIYPLEHAISMNSIQFIDLLLDSGKIDFTTQIKNKEIKSNKQNEMFCSSAKFKTYLHLIARMGNPDLLTKFLNKNYIDINTPDDFGETPLFEACRYGKIQNINVLFEHDDLDYKHCNKEGKNVFNINFDIQVKIVLSTHKQKIDEEEKKNQIPPDNQIKKEENKTEESTNEQNKTEKNTNEQNKTEKNTNEQNKIEKNTSEQNKTDKNTNEQNKIEKSNTSMHKVSFLSLNTNKSDNENVNLGSTLWGAPNVSNVKSESNSGKSFSGSDWGEISNSVISPWGPNERSTSNSVDSPWGLNWNFGSNSEDVYRKLNKVSSSSWDLMFNKLKEPILQSSQSNVTKENKPSEIEVFIKSLGNKPINAPDTIDAKSAKEKHHTKVHKYHHLCSKLESDDSDEMPIHNFYEKSAELQIDQIEQIRYTNEVLFNRQMQQIYEIVSLPNHHKRKTKKKKSDK